MIFPRTFSVSMVMLCLFLMAFLLGGPLPARADKEAMPLFHEELSRYGQWADHENYGPVWSPKKVSDNWRPYINGRWTHTPAGWVFETDEAWGAITYHFGNWAPTEELGWVWVPGSTWYPNTANWRKGKNHIGWAPIPPPNYEPPPGLAEDLDDKGPAKSELDKKTRPLYVFSKSSDFVRTPGKRYQPEANYSRSASLAPPEDLADLVSETEELDNLVALERSPKAVYNYGPSPDMLPGMGRRGRGQGGGRPGPDDLDDAGGMGGSGMGGMGPGDLDNSGGMGGKGGDMGGLDLMQLLSNVLPTKDLLNRNPSMGGLTPGGEMDNGGEMGGGGGLQSAGTSGLGAGSGSAVDMPGGGSSAAGSNQGGGWRDWMGLSSPLMILERQYAAGMITKQEYETKKNELTGQGASGGSGTSATGGSSSDGKDPGGATGTGTAADVGKTPGSGTDPPTGSKAGGDKSGTGSPLSSEQLKNMSKKDLRLELEKQLGHKLDGKYEHMTKEQLINALMEQGKGPAVKTTKDDPKTPGGKGKDPKQGEVAAKGSKGDGKHDGKPGSSKLGGIIKVSDPRAKPGLPDIKPPPKVKPVVLASIPKVPKAEGNKSKESGEKVRSKILGLPSEAKSVSIRKMGTQQAPAALAGEKRGASTPGQWEQMSKQDLRQALKQQQGGKLDGKTANLSREEIIKSLRQGGGQAPPPVAAGGKPPTAREHPPQVKPGEIKRADDEKGRKQEAIRAENDKRQQQAKMEDAKRKSEAKQQQDTLKQQEQAKKAEVLKTQKEEKLRKDQVRQADQERQRKAQLEAKTRQDEKKKQQAEQLKVQQQQRTEKERQQRAEKGKQQQAQQLETKRRQEEQRKQQADQRKAQEQQRRNQQAEQKRQQQEQQQRRQQQAQRQAQVEQQRQAQIQQQQQLRQQQAQQQILQQQQIRQQQIQQQQQARQQEEARRRQALLEQQQMQQQQQNLQLQQTQQQQQRRR